LLSDSRVRMDHVVGAIEGRNGDAMPARLVANRLQHGGFGLPGQLAAPDGGQVELNGLQAQPSHGLKERADRGPPQL